MKTVLVTRPLAQSDALVQALEKFGLHAEVFSTIEITPRTDWQRPDVSRYDGLFFTSQYAVRYFFERLHRESSLPILFPDIFVVGEKTRRALQVFGLDAAVVPEKFNAENLAALLPSRAVAHQHFLFVCGNLSRNTIPDAVHALGGRCDKLVVYETRNPKSPDLTRLFGLFEQQKIHAIAFTSPSTATNFHELIPPEKISASVLFAAIGETTAGAMRELGFPVDVVPSVSTAEALAEAIARKFQKNG
jgi:uroporphyrinogen-III synthase